MNKPHTLERPQAVVRLALRIGLLVAGCTAAFGLSSREAHAAETGQPFGGVDKVASSTFDPATHAVREAHKLGAHVASNVSRRVRAVTPASRGTAPVAQARRAAMPLARAARNSARTTIGQPARATAREAGGSPAGRAGRDAVARSRPLVAGPLAHGRTAARPVVGLTAWSTHLLPAPLQRVLLTTTGLVKNGLGTVDVLLPPTTRLSRWLGPAAVAAARPPGVRGDVVAGAAVAPGGRAGSGLTGAGPAWASTGLGEVPGGAATPPAGTPPLASAGVAERSGPGMGLFLVLSAAMLLVGLKSGRHWAPLHDRGTWRTLRPLALPG